VYCRKCGVEYREGFTVCSDCQVPLLTGTAGPHLFNPDLEVVVVLETFRVRSATLVHNVDGYLGKWVRLQVPRDREGEATELLEQLLQPVD
jgi:hypothetical protein